MERGLLKGVTCADVIRVPGRDNQASFVTMEPSTACPLELKQEHSHTSVHTHTHARTHTHKQSTSSLSICGMIRARFLIIAMLLSSGYYFTVVETGTRENT
jgi:hypothetical protein